MLRIQQLGKRFLADWGQVAAVENVSLEVPPGTLLTLLGPSGCGKTTTLRSIAGLERPDEGEITIGDQVVFSSRRGVMLPPHRRRIGMVFQSYAIWPHMSVLENVAFPLKGTGLSGSQVRERAQRALELVGLQALADRPAPLLSGGQQQRVALARALVGEPEVLLLDEPLSNLDAKLRESMRVELRLLQKRLGITAIYVTHDQVEALAISDSIAVMSGGHVLEINAPRQLYEHPRHRFTAEFVGAANLLAVSAGTPERRNGGYRVQCALGDLALGPDAGTLDGAAVGAQAFVTVRPEHLLVTAERPADCVNVWPGEVEHATFLGTYTECLLRVEATRVTAFLPGSSHLDAGQSVFVHIPPERCVLVSDTAAV